MGSLARPTAPVPCAIYTLYRDFFKPRNQIQEVMNGIRGLSSPGSLVPSFKPKFLSEYPSIYLFSKTNNSRFDIPIRSQSNSRQLSKRVPNMC